MTTNLSIRTRFRGIGAYLINIHIVFYLYIFIRISANIAYFPLTFALNSSILNIQKRPYKVITTGLIRAEDFDDEFISSNKMYETQTDVIHIKKTEKF